MENKFKHVVYSGNKWAVKEEGSDLTTFLYNTREEAIFRGLEIARFEQTELFVHNTQGKIDFYTSYSAGMQDNSTRVVIE